MANFIEKPSRLPEGYQELQWIENPDLAYITIGYDLQTTISVSWEMEFEITDTSESYVYFIGNSTNYLSFNTTSNILYFINRTTNGGGTTSIPMSNVSGKHTFRYDKTANRAYLDGTSYVAYAYGSGAPISILFGRKTATAAQTVSNFRLYRLNINGYDFFPAVRESDGQIGIFSLTTYENNGTIYFLSSANTSNFLAGPPA